MVINLSIPQGVGGIWGGERLKVGGVLGVWGYGGMGVWGYGGMGVWEVICCQGVHLYNILIFTYICFANGWVYPMQRQGLSILLKQHVCVFL